SVGGHDLMSQREADTSWDFGSIRGSTSSPEPRSRALVCASPLQRLQLRNQLLDHADAALPEGGIAGVEAKGGEKFGVVLGTTGREHRQVALGKARLGALVDGVERVHQTVAERVGVDIERRMDEVRDVGPERLVAGFQLDRRPQAFAL